MNKFLLPFIFTLIAVLTVLADGAYAFPQNKSDAPQKIQEMDSRQVMPLLSGKVVETMDSAGYTYVNIESNGKKIWVAVPQAKVTVGQNISFLPGMVMSNFTSKTLNRTFESIVFSSGVAGQGGEGSVHNPADNKKAPVASGKPIKVEKASGADAYTVAELYRDSAKLEGKGVVIRGQVVKFSSGIMGKNWIHIQDGSGDSSTGTNDILVTSQDSASVGDVITAKGTLHKDKDFGSGYKYAVIVEDASIKK
jgi:hypothetical protein